MGFNLGHFISGAVHDISHVHIDLNGLSKVAQSAGQLASSVDPNVGAGIQAGMQSLSQVAQQAGQVGSGIGNAVQAMQAARSALPQAMVPGFDLAGALARAHAAGIVPPQYLSPAAQAAYLATHGIAGGVPNTSAALAPLTASPVTAPGAVAATAAIQSGAPTVPRLKTSAHPVVYGGLGAAVAGGGALLLKFAYPVAGAIAAGGALLGYLIGHHKKAGSPSAHGEADDAADALLSFIRHNGVPAFPVQAVADFQSAVGLQPVDGRYTAQVQMALAMASSGGGTIPNPVLS